MKAPAKPFRDQDEMVVWHRTNHYNEFFLRRLARGPRIMAASGAPARRSGKSTVRGVPVRA